MRKTFKQIAFSGSNIFILLLAFFFWGESSVFFVGALLFFANGFLFPYLKKQNLVKLSGYIKSTAVFFLVIWIYFVFKLNEAAELIRLTGFLLYLADFTVFFVIGYSLTKIKTEDVKLLAFYAIVGILIYRVCVFFSHPVAGSITGIFYFLAGTHMFSKSKVKWYYIVAGLVLPYLTFYFLAGDLKELSLLNTLWIVISILFSWFFVQYKRKGIRFKNRQIVLVVSYVFVTLASYIGFLNLQEYLFNKDTQLPDNIVFTETFTNMKGQEISSEFFRGKVVVLDIWSTSCSRCFKKFPEFERFYDENKNRILIYAVGLPYNNQNRQDIEQVIRKLDYHFPFLISNNDFTHYREEYNIAGVPAIIILDKNGKVMYNSSLNNNSFVWVNNLQSLVDEMILKNE